MSDNVVRISPLEDGASTIKEELKSMEWDIQNLHRLVGELAENESKSSRDFIAKEARVRLNRLVQRCFRADQISRGLKVYR